MSGLRPLLRLEDKVAAEGRRLQHLGGPPLRWVAPMVLIAAVMFHGAILMLPAVRTRAALPASSPVPDYPLVWRPAPAVVQPQERPPTPRSAVVPRAPEPIPERPAATRLVRVLMTEPVPEPAPELALNMSAANVEAIIPYPDAPPSSIDFGPPSGAVPATPQPDAAPTLLRRVPPTYPVAARSLRAEGQVTLRLTVMPDGSVGAATVEKCSRTGLGFEAAALAAVKRWRYEPTPTPSGQRNVMVTVHFQQHEGRP